MISKLSVTIVNLLINNKDISEEDRELYQYGLFMIISQTIYFLITIICGLSLSIFFESIVFYLTFQLIRRFAGGYHANTEAKCEILSTMSILLSLIIIKCEGIFEISKILLISFVMSSLLIIVLSPLDTPEKPLTSTEFHTFRKISLLILLLISVLIVISYIFELKHLFAPSCLSLILESILLITGKIKQLHSKTHAEQ